MLMARGRRGLHDTELCWALAFGRGVWCKAIRSNGVALDTRFIPASAGAAKPSACLLLVLRGQFHSFTEEKTYEAPIAIRMSHEQLEGADRKRSYHYRNSGEPCRLIEVHFLPERQINLRPSPVTLDADTWAAIDQGCDFDSAEDRMIDGLHNVLRHLAAQGVIPADVATGATSALPKPVLRLWNLIQPLVTSFAVSSTLDDLVTAGELSSGQIERLLQRFLSTFSIVGPGLRSITYHVRMKTAVLFLSSPRATVAEVAELVGYGSPDAMARAFRDANLPPPSVVQKKLLELDGT